MAPKSERGRSSRALTAWAPPLVAVTLALPLFRFTYLWDDFDFLGRAQTFRLEDLLPDPRAIFWRPVSRELYFSLLNPLGPAGTFWAHVLNSLVLIWAVCEVGRLVRRLAGERAALSAALAFASLGSLPMLVGWVSGIQDLLAIAFSVAALRLELDRKTPLALAAAALALLSKETAVSIFPVLVLARWILGRPPYRIARGALAYGAVVLAWAAVHPGLRSLFSAAGDPGPLGLGQSDRGTFLWRTVLAMLQLPLGFRSVEWPANVTPFFLAAAALAALALMRARRGKGPDDRADSFPPRPRTALLGALFLALPIGATVMLVRLWAPYYSAMPGVGLAILLGLGWSRLPRAGAATAAVVFMTLGVWFRGIETDPLIPTERHLARTSATLHSLQEGFRRLHPSLPGRARVYLSIQATGAEGIYTHLRRFQALRVWYRDPTIVTLRFDQRFTSPDPEFLFWIGANREIVEVDLDTLRPRSSGAKPEYGEYQRAIRSYALSLGSSGETDRGVAMLQGLPKVVAADSILDVRLAAMLLLADRRVEEADGLLRVTPGFTGGEALPLMAAVLAPHRYAERFGEAALPAFGFAPRDTAAIRSLMRALHVRGLAASAARFARSLLEEAPRDPECMEVIRAAEGRRRAARLTTPISGDSI